MAPAVDSHASLQLDLATPMHSTASEPNVGGPTPYDDGQASTPTSSAIGTPRATEKNSKRRSGAKTGKSRRVRTGCFTCRERHLKCDEALGCCQNCRKSDRVCRRGIRLNFIDTQTATPHSITRSSAQVTFRDESRHIASEYVGGFERYPSPEPDIPLERDMPSQFELPGILSPSLQPGNDFSTTRPLMPPFGTSHSEAVDMLISDVSHPTFYSPLPEQSTPHATCALSKQMTINANAQPCLNNSDEMLLIRVFVEQIGPWVDSMDTSKHFTKILPFRALDEPMLLKAFMACGSHHLHPVDPIYGEDEASCLYDAASGDLLSLLQNPGRDSALCATAAIILGMYEMMCSRVFHGMNHVAGTRALIKECHWDARTPGLGGTLFWLSVSMELLNCLHFNWTLSWDPDAWGVDMNMDGTQSNVAGDEELWTHRMVYICAKIANFRSFTSQFQILNHGVSEMQASQRDEEWDLYRTWCDKWAKSVPRSMMPLGYLHTWHVGPKSAFPEVWLISQSAIVARLFYHIAWILLCKTRLLESECIPEINNIQQSHAHSICGIIAHVKDRSIASLSIRFLALAAECLTTREAQEQALEILDHLVNGTSWRAECIKDELQEAWGWIGDQQIPACANSASLHHPILDSNVPYTAQPNMPSGVVNPTMITADFSMENHPYQGYYIPPHHSIEHYQYGTF